MCKACPSQDKPDVLTDGGRNENIPQEVIKPETVMLPSNSANNEKLTENSESNKVIESSKLDGDLSVKDVVSDTVVTVEIKQSDVSSTKQDGVKTRTDDVTMIDDLGGGSIATSVNSVTGWKEENTGTVKQVSNTVPKIQTNVTSSVVSTSVPGTETKLVQTSTTVRSTIAPLTVLVNKSHQVQTTKSLKSPKTGRSGPVTPADFRHLLTNKQDTFTNEMFSHLINYCGSEPNTLHQDLAVHVPGVPKAHGGVQTATPGTAILPRSHLKSPSLTKNMLSGNQANLLANFHKLSSPPNQQVFLHVDSQTGLSVTSQSLTGYKHSIPGKRSSSAPTTPDKVKLGFTPVPLPAELLEQKAAQLHELRLLSQKYDFDPQPKLQLKPSMDSFLDSDVPPPNVDVSQLKDKGHGPIPIDLIPSLCETASNLTKHKLDVVSSNISSTSPTPKLDKDKCGSIDTDRDENVGDTVRSESACSDRLASPAVEDKDTVDISNDKSSVDSSGIPESVSSSNTVTPVSEGNNKAVATHAHLSSSSKKTLDLIVSTLSTPKPTDSIVNTTVPTPPPPTTVVHHTPGTLSCHQVSLNKAKQQVNAAKSVSEKTSDMLTDSSIINPLLAILSDPTIGQAFRHMFPDVMQEALVHSMSLQSQLTSESNPTVSVARNVAPTTSTVSLNPAPRQSLGPVPGLTNKQMIPEAAQMLGNLTRPNFPIQEMITNLKKGEFPASNLLSAAAKAQFSQQHNQLRFLFNQHGPLTGLLPNTGPVMNPSSQVSQIIRPTLGPVSIEHGNLTNLTTHSVPGQQPQGIVLTDKSGNTEKPKPSKGPSKISELLNRSVSASNRMDHVATLPNVQIPVTPGLQVPVNQMNRLTSSLPPNPMNKPDNIGSIHKTTNPVTGQLPQPPSGFQEPAKNTSPGQISQHLLQMYSALGVACQGGNSNSVHRNNVKDNSTVLNQPASNISGVPNVIPNLPNSDIRLPTPNVAMPFFLQNQQQNLPNVPPVHLQDIQQQMLSMMSAQGINPALVNLPHNQTTQIGLNQATGPVPGAQRPQMVLTGQGMEAGIQNIPRAQSQGSLLRHSTPPTSAGNPLFPMNVINMQQTFGNGGSNLTAMQLQTLQLQQQLLQQIQQVQGMQHLINQYNIQGMASGPAVSSKEASMPSTAPVTLTSAMSQPSLSQATANAPVRKRTSSENMISSSDGTVYAQSHTVAHTNGESDRKKFSRVIAAADTTAECSPSTKTVDVGIATDNVEEESNDDHVEDGNDGDNLNSCDVSNVEEDADPSDAEDLEENVFDPSVSGEDKSIEGITKETTDHTEDDTEDETEDTETKIEHTQTPEETETQTIPDEDETTLFKVTRDTIVKDIGSISPTKYVETATVSEIMPTQYKPGTTCLAIATEKGNNRSRKSEFKSFKQKSSLAKSQDLAAELSKPNDGELKLRISRKHILADTVTDLIAKKRRTKLTQNNEEVGPGVTFEKKELRSSTQAATKASSMLAASSTPDSKAQKGEIDISVEDGADTKTDKPRIEPVEESVEKPEVKTIERIGKITRSKCHVEAECDSSVEANSEQELLEDCDTGPATRSKEDIKGTIVAALSCQKGQWLLGGKKKGYQTAGEEELSDVESVPGGKGVKRNRDESQGKLFLAVFKFTFYCLSSNYFTQLI